MNFLQLDRSNSVYSFTTGALTVAASATDIFTIFGATDRIFRLLQLEIEGVQTTAGIVSVFLIKRSAANTAGTSAAVTPVAHNSQHRTPSSTLLKYTANPSGLGTAVGTILERKVSFDAAASVVVQAPAKLFDCRDSKPIELLSATEGLAVNLNGVTVTGGSLIISGKFQEVS